jgi:mevalonate kinase
VFSLLRGLFRLTEEAKYTFPFNGKSAKKPPMRAQVPGKIILSGEHAVLYNQPAVAIAVNRYASCEVFVNETDRLEILLNGQQLDRAPMKLLLQDREMIDARYQKFLMGRIPIEEVIRGPRQLIVYAASVFAAQENISIDQGLLLNIRSDIPIGCGMGSSAAVILAVYEAFCQAFDVSWSREDLYAAALRTENLQHGKSSGVDPFTCLYGGAVRFKDGQASSVEVEGLEFQLVFTGKPDCTTGECVEHVKAHFGKSNIWKMFGGVTQRFIDGLEDGDLDEISHAVIANQRLLEKIGVVPTKVAKFIEEVEFHDSVAKICGAGAIRGDAGGMVMVLTDVDLDPLIQHYGYEVLTAKVDNDGARVL